MAIISGDSYLEATKQEVILSKVGSMTAIAANFYDVIAQAGNPGAGVLAGTSTAAGVVPTDADAGFPNINAFGVGATGHITRIAYSNSVESTIRVCDVLFKAGAYANNAAVTLAAQPSFASRVPGGTDFKGLELWVEGVTAMTGNLSIAITYTDQDGNAGATTGTVATGVAPAVGRMVPIPLASGDSGLQVVESVTATVSSGGTFNVLVLRPLYTLRVNSPNDGDTWDIFRTGNKQIFADSAILPMVAPDSTATGRPYIQLEISNA